MGETVRICVAEGWGGGQKTADSLVDDVVRFFERTATTRELVGAPSPSPIQTVLVHSLDSTADDDRAAAPLSGSERRLEAQPAAEASTSVWR